MGSGFFYFKSANTVKNVKGNRFLRSSFVAGMLLMFMPFLAMAQPSFINGASQPFQVCKDAPAVTSDYLFQISDLALGSTETWTVVTPPSFGTLSGFPASGFSTGGSLGVTGTTYTPNPGYSGSDMFVVTVDDGLGNTSTTTIVVSVTDLPSFNIDAIAPVCAGGTSTTITFSALQNVGPMTSTFVYTGGTQIWAVPPTVTSVDFDVQGASGGEDNHSPAGTANPGHGARVTGTLNVGTGPLYINVGGRGSDGSLAGAAGGWNGGGDASYYFFGCGGAGGGASDIRLSSNGLGNRQVVAGGGAGNGWDSPGPNFGGAGGALIGGVGGNNIGGSHAGGGTQFGAGAGATYTGWSAGSNGAGATGGNGSTQGISGGGGGGYYGGGGGVWSGGGGGSSYANASLMVGTPSHTAGYNIGDGIVSLNYVIAGHYDIHWDATAVANGFVHVTGATLPSSPITVAVPAGAAPDTYTGTLTIDNGTCTSINYPISIVINPVPDVTNPGDQVVCNGEATSLVAFTGAVSGTTFNWTNDNPSVGIPASGTGAIGPFVGINTTAIPQIATITVTPVANGCTGTPVSFTIRVNPTPTLTSSVTPPAVCDSIIFNYTPTSGTTGATFTWFRAAVSNISNPSASGSGNPGEFLDNTSANDVTVNYSYLLAANGCFNTQSVDVVVHPTPVLNTPLSNGPICNNTLFNYPPGSSTVPTVFTWNRNLMTGISNASATGSNNPNEILHNTTNAPIAVPYQFTLVSNTCINVQTVVVTVNPTPMLNSGLTPAAICNNDIFRYGPTSLTAGTSFSWSRSVIPGILPSSNSGIDSIIEALTNTTPNPIPVTYSYILTANGCTYSQNVVVVVNPKPTLSSALTDAVCDSAHFSYTPTSLTSGTTFAWTRAAVPHITNGPSFGTNGISEWLVNDTTVDRHAIYIYTLTANGCTNTQNVDLTVHPKPKLSSSLTPGAVCDSAVFSYNPASATPGASFAWYRPYIPGIFAVASSGTDNPNQPLINSTYVVVDVVYTYTITANGCSNTQDVTVKVNPTPRLIAPFTGTVCSGSQFNYTPASYTPGALYAWNRPAVTDITPATAFVGIGTGQIHEVVNNATLSPIDVYYVYRLTINGCTNLGTQTVKLTVKPTPPAPPITTFSPNVLCTGTQFQNFGSTMPDSKVHNVWSATGADIFSVSNYGQNCVVNFNNPGTAVITLTANVIGYNCPISSSYTVNVNSSVAPHPEVVYYNNQFICLSNDNDSYQWGYDDAATLMSTTLTGEINQNYNNSNPDFNNKHYWVLTKMGDCWQKSYYNRPTGINNVNSGAIDMKVYPNPAKDVVNIEMASVSGGNFKVEVSNLLGQKLDVQTLVNNKASINVAELPAGIYLVDCYRDGVKVTATRFVKN